MLMRMTNSTAPLLGTVLLLGCLLGCASLPGDSDDSRREAIDAELRSLGLASDPAVLEQRAHVEAAIAREDTDPIFDEIELRTTAVHETDDKFQLQARIPLQKLFKAGVDREAHEAATDVEIAQLTEIALEQRVRACLPALDQRVYEERLEIFSEFAERQQALLEWNREMHDAGLLDDIRAERFELSGQVSLARSVPAPPTIGSGPGDRVMVDAALPSIDAEAPSLAEGIDVIRKQLLLNHPGVGVHRARGKSFEAQARRERIDRLPSLRFVEVGFEPTTFPGDERRYDAQLAFEIPFGREARASERRFRALASAQRNAERALIEENLRETSAAVAEINQFRSRGPHWIALLARADAAEAMADRWRRERLADPNAIARLLDEVFDARIAVLEARIRAGHAACTVLATTGASVDGWPL